MFTQGQYIHVFAGGVYYEGHYEADIIMPGLVSEEMCLVKLKEGRLGIFRKTSIRLHKELAHPPLVYSGA